MKSLRWNDSLLRPLERKDLPALARLTRTNLAFLAPTSPLRSEEHFTDEAQERALLERLEAAENGTALPMVIVDRAGDIVGTLNVNSIIRGAFQSASIGYWVSRERNGEGFASLRWLPPSRSPRHNWASIGSRLTLWSTTNHPSESSSRTASSSTAWPVTT